MYWSTSSERLYHFIHPVSSGFDVNRISYKLNYNIYSPDFLLFTEDISIQISENYKQLKLSSENGTKSILFYRK